MHNAYQQSRAEPKIEGYWYSRSESEYPMPIANVLTEDQAKAIYALIKRKEGSARVLHYKGMSFSRIEPTVVVGTKEFVTDAWRWPEGFAEHYVLKHKVKPTAEFLAYIGYQS